MDVKSGSKREMIGALWTRYRKGSRAQRGRILDEVCAATGYHRKYAITLFGKGESGGRKPRRRVGRRNTYGEPVIRALEVAATATGWICGKRLAPFLSELVPALEQEGALVLTSDVREALTHVSPATIDRRLAFARKKAKPHPLGTTKPGSLLKRQIPIRTYTPWDEERPGFCEIDLVGHCGESTAGHYLCTLDVTDVATGWTECAVVANKGQQAVVAALEGIRQRLPFPLLGLDSDNGSEFINGHLLRYCRAQQLTFTRCRTYHKNDQAHVEQKNWSIIRQLLGYDRYESEAALAQFERVYAVLHLYVNAYQPVMKLIAKQREGAKVHKRYDVPKTPYRRVLEAGVISEVEQERFQLLTQRCGPLALRRQLDLELDRLWPLRMAPTITTAATA